MLDKKIAMISEKDFKKAVENEMNLFNDVGKEYPSLGKYKEKIFEQFEKHYRALLDFVIKAHGGGLYLHNLVISGAILRSLNCYRGAIWALGNRNPHIFFDSLRSQCETLALIHYCILNPDYVEAATIGSRKHEDEELRIKNVLTMVDKVDKKHKGIRKDYDDLCELVHPNPASLYANIKAEGGDDEDKERVFIIGTKSLRVTEKKAKKYLILLIYWTDWIFEELSELFAFFKKKVEE